MAKAKKFYAVKNGYQTGIFKNWDDCKKQVTGYKGAEYKSFTSLEEAKYYLNSTVEQSTTINNPLEDKIIEDLNNGYIVAFTDGSYDVTNKKYSYGIVFIDSIINGKANMKFYNGIGPQNNMYAESRNVAGEVLAATVAMTKADVLFLKEIALYGKSSKKLKIYHDYEGVAKWITGAWKAKTKVSQEYVQAYKAIADDGLEVVFEHVKGHSNNPYNEKADELAKAALKGNG